MPNDWCYGTIQDLSTEIICGKTPSTKKKEYYGDAIPFITIPDMHNCVYALETEKKLSTLGADSQKNKTLPYNSINISCIGTAGLVTLVPYPSQTNQQINSIIPRKGYSPYFIYLMMKSKSKEIHRLGQGGSTIVNLNKAQFGKITTIIPSPDIMMKFDGIVGPIFKLILSNQEMNIRLSRLKNNLLAILLNKEVKNN